MLKMVDYRCGRCQGTFEVFEADPPKRMRCAVSGCGGKAERQLGGKPARGGSHESVPSERHEVESGYQCSVEETARIPMRLTMETATIDGDLVLFKHSHAPKAKA